MDHGNVCKNLMMNCRHGFLIIFNLLNLTKFLLVEQKKKK